MYRRVARRDGEWCAACGVTSSTDYLTLDHFRPQSRGGSTTLDNLWLLCDRHNRAKGDAWYKADGSREGVPRGLPDWRRGEEADFEFRMWDKARKLERERTKQAQSPLHNPLPTPACQMVDF